MLHKVLRRSIHQTYSRNMATVGSTIPNAIKLQEGNPGAVVTTDEIFVGKKVVLIGVPGNKMISIIFE
jgi:DUF917 family protein